MQEQLPRRGGAEKSYKLLVAPTALLTIKTLRLCGEQSLKYSTISQKQNFVLQYFSGDLLRLDQVTNNKSDTRFKAFKQAV